MFIKPFLSKVCHGNWGGGLKVCNNFTKLMCKY